MKNNKKATHMATGTCTLKKDTSLKDTVQAICAHHEKLNHRLDEDQKLKKRIYSNRKKLASNIEDFHKKTGTYTESIESATDILKKKQECIFLMTAHQTNFIPYSGVVRKTTLMHVIRKELEKTTGISTLEYFGLADQDMTSSWPWLTTTQLPSIFHKNGILELRHNTPETYASKIHASVPKPTSNDISQWHSQTLEWIKLCSSSITKRTQESPDMTKILSNFNSFFTTMEEARQSSDNFAEMNAMLLSKITNIDMDHNTLFSKYTETQKNFIHEFAWLLSNSSRYHIHLNEVKPVKVEKKRAPFWYHCECLGKVELEVTENETTIELTGKCPSCSKTHSFTFDRNNLKKGITSISKNISARARPMALIFFEGLGVDMYVGGALANKCYIKETEYIAGKLGSNYPAIAVWRPRDIYRGLGQISCHLEKQAICENTELKQKTDELEKELETTESELKGIDELIRRTTSQLDRNKLIKEKEELRKQHDTRTISRNIATLKKIPNTESVYPSILDYAVNIGLKETKDAWIQSLEKNESMDKNIIIGTTNVKG